MCDVIISECIWSATGFKRPDALTSCHLAARVHPGAKQRATWAEKTEQVRRKVRRKVSRLGMGVGRSNQIARPTQRPARPYRRLLGDVCLKGVSSQHQPLMAEHGCMCEMRRAAHLLCLSPVPVRPILRREIAHVRRGLAEALTDCPISRL